MARSVLALCPYFRDLYGRELKGLLVIIPKVVISLLMVSRGIIPFEEHIAAVGTTSNNMLSKRKTLDEGSL